MTLQGFVWCWPGFAVLAACRADVLVGAMRLDSSAAFSMVPGAWYVI